MLRHNLLLIYRNFKRFKTTFFINLIGLSTGLACTLLIYLWVNDELGMDRFHTLDARLFQLMEHQQHSGSVRVTDSTPWLLAEALEDEMPEIEHAVVATPTYWFSRQTLSVDDNPVKANGKYAGEGFFKIFSFELLAGNKDNVLSDKNSIVISEDLARKLFDTTLNVLGRTIIYQQDQLFKVSGVFRNLPANSSEYFDFVLPYRLLTDAYPDVVDWRSSGPQTFVLLKEGTNVADFRKKISGFISTKCEDKHRTLLMPKYSDMYLHGNYAENGVQSGGRIEYVGLFSLVAIFILIIACINFMNLSTAKAAGRIKEVGIKKVAGARRRTLVVQYLAESMLMTVVAVAVAVLIVDVFLPQFNEITGKHLVLQVDRQLAVSVIGIILFTGLISGSYPALYLSGFSPAAVLKGKLNTSFGELWARKGLVVFQFTLSVILIVSVLVVYKQIEFVQRKNLGYNKDNVIYFPNEGKIKTSLDAFLDGFNKIPGVVKASSIAQSMIGGGNTTEISWEGKDPQQRTPFAVRPVNYDIIEMLDLKIVEGRSFSREHSTDTSAVIFNEAGIKAMAIKDPVGKEITMSDGSRFTIIGVVKNFHYESLHSDVAPLFFGLKPQYTETIMAKIAAGNQAETLGNIEKFYKQFNPGFPFDYRFLDTDYQALYGDEIRVSILSRYFAGIAIVISCLGLFGLAAFTAERRRKEIGIRKVLGSSELKIVYLLSGDFSKLVILSALIALPISYMLTRQWLDTFVFRITLAWWYFALAGVLALFIALVTVGTQAVRAAKVNPTQCLRDE
jgi:putative ABC transport system permease protein